MLHMLHKGEIKQAIIIRSDLDMSKGKLAAQAAHASLMSFFEAAPNYDRLLYLSLV